MQKAHFWGGFRKLTIIVEGKGAAGRGGQSGCGRQKGVWGTEGGVGDRAEFGEENRNMRERGEFGGQRGMRG